MQPATEARRGASPPSANSFDRGLTRLATGPVGRVAGFFGTLAIALWRTATGIERRERERRRRLLRENEGDRGPNATGGPG